MLGAGILGATGLLILKFFEEKKGRVLFRSIRVTGDRLVRRAKQTVVALAHDVDESAAHRIFLVAFQKVTLILLWGIKRFERAMVRLLHKSRKKQEELRKREPSSSFLKDVRAHKDSLTPPPPPEL